MRAYVNTQEPKCERQIYKHPKDFIRYTQTRLMRVYPGPLRVDSSNFNPSLYWATGVQMVALNVQTAGVATQLNQVGCTRCMRLRPRSRYALVCARGVRHRVMSRTPCACVRRVRAVGIALCV